MISRFFQLSPHLSKVPFRISCLSLNSIANHSRNATSCSFESISSPVVFTTAETIGSSEYRLVEKSDDEDGKKNSLISELDDIRAFKDALRLNANREKLVADLFSLTKSVIEGKYDVEHFLKTDTFSEIDRQVHLYIDLMSNSQVVSLLISLIKMHVDPSKNLVKLLEHEIKFRARDMSRNQAIKLIKCYQSIEISSEQKQVVDILNHRLKYCIQNESISLSDLLELVQVVMSLATKDTLMAAVEERLLYNLAIETDDSTVSHVLPKWSMKGADYKTLCKLFTVFADCRRRPTPILKQACTLISQIETPRDVDVQELAGVLKAIAVLNYPNRQLLARLVNDLTKALDLKQVTIQYQSQLLHSLCLLRWKSESLLNKFYQHILENQDNTDLIDHNLIVNIFYTTALLHYEPEIDLKKLYESCMKARREENLTRTGPKWLSYVWTLAALDIAETHHFESVLNDIFIQDILSDDTKASYHGSLMKLLNLNALAKYKHKLNCADPSAIQKINFRAQRGAALQSYVSKLNETITNLVSSPEEVRLEVITPFGFIIDCEMLLSDSDQTAKPLNNLPTLAEVLENRDSRIAPDGHTRFALIYAPYFDTIQSDDKEVTGYKHMIGKILRALGYQVAFLPEPVISREKTSADIANKIQSILEISRHK